MDANCDIFLPVASLGWWLRKEHWSSTFLLFSFSRLQTPVHSILYSAVRWFSYHLCHSYHTACHNSWLRQNGKSPSLAFTLSPWPCFVRAIWAEKLLLHSSVMTLTKLLRNHMAFQINSLSCDVCCVGKFCLQDEWEGITPEWDKETGRNIECRYFVNLGWVGRGRRQRGKDKEKQQLDTEVLDRSSRSRQIIAK